jgi:hypothetical protein
MSVPCSVLLSSFSFLSCRFGALFAESSARLFWQMRDRSLSSSSFSCFLNIPLCSGPSFSRRHIFCWMSVDSGIRLGSALAIYYCAAIWMQNLASHIGRVVGRQKYETRCDLLWLSRPTQRNVGPKFFDLLRWKR